MALQQMILPQWLAFWNCLLNNLTGAMARCMEVLMREAWAISIHRARASCGVPDRNCPGASPRRPPPDSPAHGATALTAGAKVTPHVRSAGPPRATGELAAPQVTAVEGSTWGAGEGGRNQPMMSTGMSGWRKPRAAPSEKSREMASRVGLDMARVSSLTYMSR